MIVYHGTTVERAREILRHGFKVKRGKVTNDLGSGVYTYCDDDNGAWDPYLNAMKFAKRFRRGRTCVLKVTVDDNEVRNNSLNLDYPGMPCEWEIVRKSFEDNAEKIWKGFPHGNAKKRHNIDGIILEKVFKSKNIFTDENNSAENPSCVLKQTYTSFISHTLSNFPNGRELVIRNLGMITKIEIQED